MAGESMEKNKSSIRVCVIGGGGYVGSSLVKKLLEKGYTVHATLRNLNEESQAGLLKSFGGADERLRLSEADLFNSEEIEQAIDGCEFVFLVATPTPARNERFDTVAVAEAVKNIAKVCIRCGSVRRLIYTAAAPLREEGGGGFKHLVDETCWTPLPLCFGNCDNYNGVLRDYVESKTLAEKQVLKMGKDGVEVVSLALGFVGGETCLPYCPSTVATILKFLEDLFAKIPIVHIEDVCDAHIFAMEANASFSGRFFCANFSFCLAEIAQYLRQNFPEFHVNQE